MDKVANLPATERNDLFAETAAVMRTVPAIVEKDFWVVWVLDKLFSDALLNKRLQFKGGTSLSKAFDLIGRFSEDIDLILDWREVTPHDPQQARSKSQQTKLNIAINEQAKEYIKEKLLPEISGLLAPVSECHMDGSDGFSIYVRYPTAFRDTYLRSEILLEIGPLAGWLPSGDAHPFLCGKTFSAGFCKTGMPSADDIGQAHVLGESDHSASGSAPFG